MKSAAIYIRVSTDDQVEYSPDAQLRALKSWARSNDYFIDQDHIYVDEGISGRRAERRPAFMAMISAAKQKPSPFEAILVHKFDRFARSREDSVVYKSLLRKECGVRVISITESIEDDKFSIILEAMLEAMAEYYSINLGEEVRKGMSEKARRGERQSGAPFGYRTVNGQLVPDPTEAPAVKYLFDRFAGTQYSAETYFALTRWLNEHGFRTSRGNTFQNRTVRYILTNPTYVGLNAWTPDRSKKSNREYLIDETTLLEKGSHEPLVDRETWDRVQARIADLREQFGHNRRPAHHADWISGLVHCSVCGEPMVRSVRCRKSGSTYAYWTCNGYAHGRCSHPQGVSDTALKQHLIDAIRASSQDVAAMSSAARSALQSRSASESFPHILRTLDARLARAKDAFQAGVDTLEEYAAAKRAILAERNSILARMQADSVDEQRVAALAARFGGELAALADLLASSASVESKHESAHSAIKQAVWDKSIPSLSVLFSFK